MPDRFDRSADRRFTRPDAPQDDWAAFDEPPFRAGWFDWLLLAVGLGLAVLMAVGVGLLLLAL